MDEIIDILNAKGEKTGKTCMKSEAHKKGLYHASVHIWIFDNDGNMLIQRRALDKDTHPDHWDVSVAGHIAAGELPISSAIREIKEEIGLTIKDTSLEKIGYFKSAFIHRENLKDFEYHHTYVCKYPLDLKIFTLQKEEVAELTILSLSQFKNEIKEKESDYLLVPYEKKYYQFVVKEIEKRTKNQMKQQ